MFIALIILFKNGNHVRAFFFLKCRVPKKGLDAYYFDVCFANQIGMGEYFRVFKAIRKHD